MGEPFIKLEGVRKVFRPGTTLAEIVEWVNANVTPRAL